MSTQDVLKERERELSAAQEALLQSSKEIQGQNENFVEQVQLLDRAQARIIELETQLRERPSLDEQQQEVASGAGGCDR